jgi:hypothetical protein
MKRSGLAILAAVFSLTFSGAPASAASRYDPRLRFRTISTPRFDIHYHHGEEALAQRLARIAEEVAATLDRSLGQARGRVQVILVDQDDLPNGWATPLPYNTIEITAAAPAADSLIGNTADWLRLVFTHEYTHIVHLSRSGGWIGGLRRVFGRLPVLFPNLFQPIWQIEGVATWQESYLTGAGRVRAGDFRLLLERAAAEQRLEPIDRASNVLADWPSGNTPYLYGGFFHQYLADRYGPESLRRLTDETSRRIPYLGSNAFKEVFGRSLGVLWDEFEASVRAAAPEQKTAERLTRHGFLVSGPRFAGPGRMLYSLANPHGFPSLMELDLPSRRSRRIATRYLGTQVGLAGRDVVFDQIEIVRDVGRQSDLYILRANGDVTRLSYGARASDPDVSPDGSRIAFTVQRADRRELATAPLAPAFQLAPTALVSVPEVDFASPRWSPDGAQIAAERRRRGGASEIVVVDATTGVIRVLVPHGRNATPVWSPDGSHIFFAFATDRDPFRLGMVPSAGGDVRVLDSTGASAQWPAISPDGRWLAFVGYTADGFDLYSLPLADARWAPYTIDEPKAVPPAEAAAEPLPSKGYSPWRTILPTFWTPTLESDEGEFVAGAATGSFDVLARHAYGAEGGWATSRVRPDWQIAYAYDRWRPTFFAAVSDDTDPWRGGERRIVEANAGMLLRSRRIRWSQTVLAELHGSREEFGCTGGVDSCAELSGVRVGRASARTGLAFNSAREFGYSISSEEGGRLSTTLEAIRSTSVEGLTALAATVDVRRYLQAWPRHAAVAIRAAGAASWGDAPVRRQFSASGSEPQPGGFRFGGDAIGLIRGLAEDRVLGSRAAVVNVDYRFPLAYFERGVGTLPIFLHAVHGAVFVDAGHAWTGRFDGSDIRYSIGAELSMDAIVGYFAPLTFSTGAAWRGGPDTDERGFAAFARIGKAF